jgi:murein DD-endopeptidase MepM/ murein hydrolase activator NlpD
LHQGLDFQGPIGAPITSSADGIVEKAGWDPQYGNEIIINHGDGYMTRYAHASELLVNTGDRVSRSQVIAKIGQSGRSTGPHLHFEILKNGKVVDPQAYLIGNRKVN